jgi:RNA 3'-terminal phosphate cyclase (ATP)
MKNRERRNGIMLVIDGAHGEGGGQILRTSLTMAMVTGTDVQIKNIRAGRQKPGLMRQHLACVKAAQAISDAEVQGAKVGSTAITFKPKRIRAGDYQFAVGTAGSTTLIFQTVLPALALADGVSTLRFSGGTHNLFAPSFDFIDIAFLPLMKKMGIGVHTEFIRHGFYPQGGGEWRATITPAERIGSLTLLETGELQAKEAVAISANIPGHVAVRELSEVARLCGWPQEVLRVEQVKCHGSGNTLSLRLHYEHCAEVVESIGQVGVPAEKVARQAVKAMQRFLAAKVPVGEHLADQLLLPMALGEGGVFHTQAPSRHARTNRDVIKRFSGKHIAFREVDEDRWVIDI